MDEATRPAWELEQEARAINAAPRHGEAAVSLVPLLLRRTSGQPRAEMSGLRQAGSPPRFPRLTVRTRVQTGR